MPGVRSKGQVLVGTYADESFLKRIDAARGALSRSQFLRDALKEKLERMKIPVHDLLTTHPDRAGKGGPKRNQVSGGNRSGKNSSTPLVNLHPDSNLDPEVKSAADALEEEAKKRIRVKRRVRS